MARTSASGGSCLRDVAHGARPQHPLGKQRFVVHRRDQGLDLRIAVLELLDQFDAVAGLAASDRPPPGRAWCARLRGGLPATSPASPQVSRSGSRAITSASPRRTSGWSSTSRMRYFLVAALDSILYVHGDNPREEAESGRQRPWRRSAVAAVVRPRRAGAEMVDAGAAAGRGIHFHAAAQQFQPLADAEQSEARPWPSSRFSARRARNRRLRRRRPAQTSPSGAAVIGHPGAAGVGVLDHVEQQLAGRLEQHDAKLLAAPARPAGRPPRRRSSRRSAPCAGRATRWPPPGPLREGPAGRVAPSATATRRCTRSAGRRPGRSSPAATASSACRCRRASRFSRAA